MTLALAIYWQVSFAMALILLLLSSYYFVLHERVIKRHQREFSKNEITDATVTMSQHIYSVELRYKQEIDFQLRK